MRNTTKKAQLRTKLTTKKIFSDPKHNYTKKLLTSIPHPDPKDREIRKKERLAVK